MCRASYEEDASESHDIEPNGYDIGRYVILTHGSVSQADCQ